MSVGEDALKSLGEDAKGEGEVVERLLVLISYLHILVVDYVDADLILPDMVGRKHVYLSVFSKMRKISCRT